MESVDAIKYNWVAMEIVWTLSVLSIEVFIDVVNIIVGDPSS